ncbi:hypothetical protein EG329_002530 [Mollisiaceae sp. DMI_Dod_QoI]|nr:hypothetical protein EG329_002530 [Helotiales sp. DMI_Dod_QoI]
MDREESVVVAKNVHRPYRNVAAFLLSWTRNFDPLDFAAEKRKLGNVLRDTFRYIIVEREVTSGKPQPEIQVQNLLGDFMLEYDNDDTLLLFYYIGRSCRGKSVVFTSHSENSIEWQDIEATLRTTRGDVLAILDTSYSGPDIEDHNPSLQPFSSTNVGGIDASLPKKSSPVALQASSLPSKGGKSDGCSQIGSRFDPEHDVERDLRESEQEAIESSRRLKIDPKFELMCACARYVMTYTPGPNSFTSALIWALRTMSRSTSHFTPGELLQKAKEAPNFPSSRCPILVRKASIPNIILSPLYNAEETEDAQRTAANAQNHGLTGYMDDTSSERTSSASVFGIMPHKAESTLPTTASGQADIYKEDNEDSQTIFTDNQSLQLPDDARAHLVNVFAGDILNVVTGLPVFYDDSVARIGDALPGLLKEFAQELSQSARPGVQKDAVTFVRHYRTRSFREAVQWDDNEAESPVPITVEEKMTLWKRDNLGPESIPVERPEDTLPQPDKDDDSDTDDDQPIPDYAEARNFLFGSEAYQGLRRRIRAASMLTSRRGQIVEVIWDAVMKTLIENYSHIGQKGPLPSFQSVELVISWDLFDFLTTQYGDRDFAEFKDILVLSGSSIDAQATTCGFNDVRVEAMGPILGVADAIEQLTWLGAACRTSPCPNRLSYSSAYITKMNTRKPSFSIKYSMEDLEPGSSEESGACWHALLKNPVIVKGFPILARRYGEKGLEIPLNILAGLGEAERATVFGDQLLIKGFSTMFVPTLQTQESILWHFVFDDGNKRMPYTAAKERCLNRLTSDVINYASLTGRRHFLGWASSVNLKTGASSNKYTDLEFTGSSFARAGCALEKVTISGGKIITAGVSFARSNKDSTLVRSALGPYEKKIYAASWMKVILYDTTDRRAWLIDGANALLHMTRAQLSRQPCCDSELLDLRKFPHPNPDSGYNAGYQSLKAIGKSNDLYIFENDPNFGQSTSVEKRWGVKDLVLENWNILEQIQDHQQDMAGPGMQIRLTDRDKLEGFGFVDIISGIPVIRPRVATLESSGRGWVDFVREINAITLMARGFGTLITPAKDCNNLCSQWQQVPKGKDYLIARADHLKSICKEMGNLNSQPLELVQGIYVHSGGALFDACSCGSNPFACDRVQVLLPKHTIGFKRKSVGLFDGDLKGAVVFGRSNRFSTWWPRNPKVGPKDSEAACIYEDDMHNAATAIREGIFRDSGVGSERTQSKEGTPSSHTRNHQEPSSGISTLVSAQKTSNQNSTL